MRFIDVAPQVENILIECAQMLNAACVMIASLWMLKAVAEDELSAAGGVARNKKFYLKILSKLFQNCFPQINIFGKRIFNQKWMK